MRKTDMGSPGRKSAILWSSQREGNATCWPLSVLAASIGALALINIATAMRLGRTTEVSDQEVFLQLCADVALLTASLYFTGGGTHPFLLLYLVALMISATGVASRFSLAHAGRDTTGYS